MVEATASSVLLSSDSASAVEDLRRLLEREGHTTGWHALDGAGLFDLAGYDLVVLDGSQRDEEAFQFCHALRARLTDRLLPILLVTTARSSGARRSGVERGADACLVRPFVADELLAQVNGLLRLKKRHDRLAGKSADSARVHQQLQQVCEQIDQEIELARRVQKSLLPRTLPDMPPARFAVRYQPCGRTGGDFYDVFQLDENHVGFYVADVVGHGVPASLWTVLLKKAVCFKEIAGRAYRLVAPHEALDSLNREMMALAAADSPFISMVYALFDGRDHTLAFARAGHPHPIHVPRRGEPKLCPSHGTLLGVFETQFTTQTLRLRPGDKLLLHTDGLDALTATDKVAGSELLLALAKRHAQLPVQEFVSQVVRDLMDQTREPEDFTLLGLEVGD